MSDVGAMSVLGGATEGQKLLCGDAKIGKFYPSMKCPLLIEIAREFFNIRGGRFSTRVNRLHLCEYTYKSWPERIPNIVG